MSTPIGHRPSGMAWAVLRLHRTALVLWGAALIAVAGLATAAAFALLRHRTP